MEAAGLAIGIIGLTGLFTACIDCFYLIERGRNLDADYAILEQKFSNLQGRFEAWGRACGLFEFVEEGDEEEGEDWDAFKRGVSSTTSCVRGRQRGGSYSANTEWLTENPELRARVEGTLKCVQMLFGDGKRLGGRYGLAPYSESSNSSSSSRYADYSPETATPSSPLSSLLSSPSIFSRAFKPRITSPSTSSPSSSSSSPRHHRQPSNPTHSTSTAIKWIIADHSKFTTLISHLRDFIEDLESLTAHLGVPARQRFYVEYEIESISDVATLERIEAAGLGCGDSVADAASVRLGALRSRGGSLRASLESGEAFDGDFDVKCKCTDESIVCDSVTKEEDIVAGRHRPRIRSAVSTGDLTKEFNRMSAATMPEEMNTSWDERGLPVKSAKRRWRFFKRK